MAIDWWWCRTSPFDQKMTIRDRLDPSECICDLWSPRMRTLWKSACDSGDFDGFAGAARHRNEVYRQSIPEFHQLKELAQARSRLNQQFAVNSALFGGSYMTTPVLNPSEAYRMTQLENAWKAVE